MTSHTVQVGRDQVQVRITFFIKELEMYICFNRKWHPRLFVSVILSVI